jgi:hypothetical protein
MSIDDIYQLLDDTANMLRGMKMDPAIPRHAKEAMGARIQTIEEALEKLEPQLGG